MLLGLWGGLVPFIGPHFGYAYTPDSAWTMTWGRLWLEVLPAAAAIIGGLMLAGSTNRAVAHAGGWVAAAAGAWFIIGPSVSNLWASGTPGAGAGAPTATTAVGTAAQEIGLFYGLGAVILFLGAAAVGRFSIVNAKDVAPATHARHSAEPVPQQRTQPGTDET